MINNADKGTKKKKSRSEIKMYVFTILFTLVAMLTMAIYSFWSFYSNAREDTLKLGEAALAQEREQLTAYLSKGMDVVQVTAINVESMMQDNASSEVLLDALTYESQYYKEKIDENFSGVYGFFNGEYIDGIGWTPEEDYVPQERDWYIAAEKAGGKSVIVSPYVDAQTGNVMISISQMLYDDESVISFDIAMNRIQELTEQISMDENGYGFICDKKGLVVAHSDAREKGKNYLQVEGMSDLLNRIYMGNQTRFSMEINGEKCTVFSDVIMDDWYVVMVVNDADLFKNVQGILIRNIIICLSVFLLVVIFCTRALRRADRYMKKLRASQKELKQVNENILGTLARTIDAKDKYTKGHSARVAEYSRMIAERMGKTEEEQELIYNAALLHDIGKIRIPDTIINKPGKLTDEEYNLIKLHSVAGFYILKGISGEQTLEIGAKYHHERFDGRGYPNGIEGEKIPEISRIIGVADAYDAMASNRSYRDVLPQQVIREELIKGRGKQFDCQITDVMLQMMDEDKEYRMRQTDTYRSTILVVDDDDLYIKMMEYIFKSEPLYDCISATSGAEALQKMEEYDVDLVFLDIEMPQMNGYEVLKRIKEKYSVPVIFLTGDRDLDVRELMKLGVEDCLMKPVQASIVMEIAHIILNG